MPHVQYQIKITLSQELHTLITQKARRLGLKVTQRVLHLIVKDVENETKPANLVKQPYDFRNPPDLSTPEAVDTFLDSLVTK